HAQPPHSQDRRGWYGIDARWVWRDWRDDGRQRDRRGGEEGLMRGVRVEGALRYRGPTRVCRTFRPLRGRSPQALQQSDLFAGVSAPVYRAKRPSPPRAALISRRFVDARKAGY